jgi:predicted aspartyl protease
MQLILKDSLPFTNVTIAYQGKIVEVQNVLVDTGSGGTVMSADIVSRIGISPKADDILHTIHGVGGSEVVFTRKENYLRVGDKSISDFEIEISGMDYGFEIKGILGMDF